MGEDFLKADPAYTDICAAGQAKEAVFAG